MTNFNKTTLATFFQTGDVPQGSDYTNLINSQVNLVETAEQDMAGPLYTTKLITPRVSAATINNTTKILAAAAQITGIISADGGINTTTVSAAVVNSGVFRTSLPVIISAAGTVQATAAPISATVGISRLQGVADGVTTGFLLASPTGNIGIEQVLVCEAAVSCNLWPSVGCKINGLGANAAFGLAANTPYYVTYTQASAYAVK